MTEPDPERRDVYGPAEDSSLLANAVADHVEPGEVLLDVGTGSGYVAAILADRAAVRVLGSDINPAACRRARERGIPAVRADLLDPFRTGVFDVVVFNPPYLPAAPEAEFDAWFERAVTGGTTGRAVIDRFLDAVGRVLAPHGRAFLLVSTLTGLDAVVERAGRRGFHVVAIAEDHYPGETLTVLKLVA